METDGWKRTDRNGRMETNGWKRMETDGWKRTDGQTEGPTKTILQLRIGRDEEEEEESEGEGGEARGGT